MQMQHPHAGRSVRSAWQGSPALIPAMLRTWCAACEIGENPLPHMMDKAGPMCSSPEVAVACDSLFAFAEAVIGRRLVPECCCSMDLSADEQAMMTLVCTGPSADAVRIGGARSSHGLAEALCWAVIAVRRSLRNCIAG